MAITLKAARANKDLTLAEASQRIGVTKNTLWKWENGKAKPGIEYVDKLLNIYGMRYEDIIFIPSEYT